MEKKIKDWLSGFLRISISPYLHILLLLTSPLHAADLKIYVSSGTGFLVSREGHIVTNLHVVSYCQRIEAIGLRGVRTARLVSRDAENDLALLKIDVMGSDPAEFADPAQPVARDDRVVIVGFPGRVAQTGETVTRESTIFEPKGPQGEEKWLQLGDVIEQGNSGGPLLDSGGNVVGVVSAKGLLYTYRQDAPEDGTTRRFGVAVAAPVVTGFLDRNHVRYRTASTGLYLSADRITDSARNFVVNIRCQYQAELR